MKMQKQIIRKTARIIQHMVWLDGASKYTRNMPTLCYELSSLDSVYLHILDVRI